MLVTWRGEAQIRRYFWVFSTTETARGMLCKNRAELPPRDEAAAADSWGWGCGRVQWAGSSGGTWHQWPSRRRHYHSKTTKPSLSPIATLIQSPDQISVSLQLSQCDYVARLCAGAPPKQPAWQNLHSCRAIQPGCPGRTHTLPQVAHVTSDFCNS